MLCILNKSSFYLLILFVKIPSFNKFSQHTSKLTSIDTAELLFELLLAKQQSNVFLSARFLNQLFPLFHLSKYLE